MLRGPLFNDDLAHLPGSTPGNRLTSSRMQDAGKEIGPRSQVSILDGLMFKRVRENFSFPITNSLTLT